MTLPQLVAVSEQCTQLDALMRTKILKQYIPDRRNLTLNNNNSYLHNLRLPWLDAAAGA